MRDLRFGVDLRVMRLGAAQLEPNVCKVCQAACWEGMHRPSRSEHVEDVASRNSGGRSARGSEERDYDEHEAIVNIRVGRIP